MINKQKADELWRTLSIEEQKYLIGKHVLTGFEARHVLGVNASRLSTLVQNGKLRCVKKDTSAMLFLLSDVEKRVEEAKMLRRKYVPKIKE